MQEFDPCPACREDLLLEDPDNNGNGLKCNECGYTCEATEPEPDSFSDNDLLETQKRAYWKRRCEAAEKVIESINAENEGILFMAKQTWLEIKNEEEPV